MAKEQRAQDKIIQYLKNGGHAEYLGKHFPTAPWVVIEQTNGRDVYDRYSDAKPARDMEALKTANPRRHAALAGSMRAFETMRQTRDSEAYEKLREKARLYVNFCSAAIDSFKPAGYPGGIDDVYTAFTSYVTLHNPQTNQYLAIAQDKRSDGKATPENKHKRHVDCQIIEGKNLTQSAALEKVHQFYVGHLTRAMRFSPITERAHVKAMYEAERVNKHHANGDKKPARPLRDVFEFYPAFRRAYTGEEGFKQALTDIYGPTGTAAYCHAQGVRSSDWGGYNSGADIAKKYEVSYTAIIGLYEKMPNEDRQVFAKTFVKFIDQDLQKMMEGMGEKKRSLHAHLVYGSLALVKIAVEHGSGALQSAHFPDMMMDETLRTECNLNGDKRFSNRPPRVKKLVY